MPIQLQTIRWSTLDCDQRKRVLRRPAPERKTLENEVAAILREVREGGDPALASLTRQLDGRNPRRLEWEAHDLKAAAQSIGGDLAEAVADAAAQIRRFHSADIPVGRTVETVPGLNCEVRYQALSPVGLYIPGGSAPLVSTVLMLAIPARIAGCREVVLCSPPDSDGRIAAPVLAAAAYCSVDRVFCAGGAQAIAAMAYGTETVPRCAKIFGPGNAWVTEAKQQVSRDPAGAAIDLPAGPSEVLVIADQAADPEFVAWDLLSQAEHGPDSQVLLATDSSELAASVAERVTELAADLPRAAILEKSLRAARILLVADVEEALAISNRYAPEHLILNTRKADRLAARIRNAGSVFIGPWTPESLGDYCSGTNHVLPTGGWARCCGALGVADFMRRMTLQEADPAALARLAPTASTLASAEGLEAHRMAVRSRVVNWSIG